jgi:hypothetical protein
MNRDLFVNFCDKKYTNDRFMIANEFGRLAIVYANCEQDALDIAADNGKLNSERMGANDYAEYLENGWDDSYLYAGNDGSPYWCEYLTVKSV